MTETMTDAVADTREQEAVPCECVHARGECSNTAEWLVELNHTRLAGCDGQMRLLLCDGCKDNAVAQAERAIAREGRCNRCGWQPHTVADMMTAVKL